MHATVIDVIDDDGPARSETCKSLMFCKYYCELNDDCVHVLFTTVENMCNVSINGYVRLEIDYTELCLRT